MIKHADFLQYVQTYIEENPDAAAYISEFAARGVERARKNDLERAADMEVMLSVAMARRFKEADQIILDKLMKWNGKTALNWQWAIEKLDTK